MLGDGDASAAQRGEVLRAGGEDRDRPGAANAVPVWRAISFVGCRTRSGELRPRPRCGLMR